MSVEAAFIMGITLMLVLFLLGWSFYLHDRIVLFGLTETAALESCRRLKYTKGPESDAADFSEIRRKSLEDAARKLLVAECRSLSISRENGQIRVELLAALRIPGAGFFGVGEEGLIRCTVLKEEDTGVAEALLKQFQKTGGRE